MRLLFAGTPEVALPSLARLLASPHEVAAVLTRPDAPAGRGRRLAPSPVRVAAEQAGLPVLTQSLRDPEAAALIAGLDVDLAVVVAYGGLVPATLLDVPRHGWVNLHFSSAARLAGRRARAARVAARRRDDGRDDVPARGRPGHRTGVRHLDGGDPAEGHRGRAPGPPGARGGGSARGDRRRAGGRDARGDPAAHRRREPGPAADTAGRRGALGAPGDRGGPPGAGLHPGSRCVDHRPGGRAAQARPGAAASGRCAAADRAAAGGQDRGAGRHRDVPGPAR